MDVLKKLKRQSGKDIWVCGGANLIGQLMRENLIDVYDISVIPVLLGSGIRLFEDFQNRRNLCLVKTQRDNGMVELVYENKRLLP